MVRLVLWPRPEAIVGAAGGGAAGVDVVGGAFGGAAHPGQVAEVNKVVPRPPLLLVTICTTSTRAALSPGSLAKSDFLSLTSRDAQGASSPWRWLGNRF